MTKNVRMDIEHTVDVFHYSDVFYYRPYLGDKPDTFAVCALYTPSLALERKTLGDTHPVPSLVCVLLFFFAFIIFTVFQNIVMLFSRQAIEFMGFYCFA